MLISIILNIAAGLKNKEPEKALFGNNGLAGVVFFGALLAGVVCGVFLNISVFTAPYVVCLIALPLAVMFLREPLSCWVKGRAFKCDSAPEFLTASFFEVFEYVLGYATNTLSFVRIGGFMLSHAGMMAVVLSLSESVSAGASFLVVVVGNIFVIAMEGLIVGIQVLRLEFYEMFSRFYETGGKAFSPVKTSYRINE
jgi:V/A-type H+-transporting ATPase subunit I